MENHAGKAFTTPDYVRAMDEACEQERLRLMEIVTQSLASGGLKSLKETCTSMATEPTPPTSPVKRYRVAWKSLLKPNVNGTGPWRECTREVIDEQILKLNFNWLGICHHWVEEQETEE